MKECSAENSVAENCHDHEKEDVTSEKPDDQKSSSPTSNSSEHTTSTVLQPSAVSTEKDASDTTPHVEAESAADGNYMQSPYDKKTSQVTETFNSIYIYIYSQCCSLFLYSSERINNNNEEMLDLTSLMEFTTLMEA